VRTTRDVFESILYVLENSFISLESKCGPLSLISTEGTPWRENVDFRQEIAAFDVVEFSFITSRYLEKYSSPQLRDMLSCEISWLLHSPKDVLVKE